jgi:Fungal specific transcription factor domain
MWTHAAAIMPKYQGLQGHFYRRSRKYVEQIEMQGHGEDIISVAHSQTWTLLAAYEFKQMFFPRAWMSTGRAIRLAQMMGLHRLDGVGLDVKQSLAPPKDWTEREERSRTFWMAFCMDRYASIGTGWPMIIDEKDVSIMLSELYARLLTM